MTTLFPLNQSPIVTSLNARFVFSYFIVHRSRFDSPRVFLHFSRRKHHSPHHSIFVYRIITRYQTRYPVITRCGRGYMYSTMERRKEKERRTSIRPLQRTKNRDLCCTREKEEKTRIPSLLVPRIENEILYRSVRGQGTATREGRG